MNRQITEQEIDDMLESSDNVLKIYSTEINGIKEMVDAATSFLSFQEVPKPEAEVKTESESIINFVTGLIKYLNARGARTQLEARVVLSNVEKMKEAKQSIGSGLIIPQLRIEKNT
jgi:hypothetical protein